MVLKLCILLGSYYTYWSYYTYCLNFSLIESIISTGRSQKKSIVLFFLLLYYSSYYTYWLENFPPFTNISTGWSKKMGWNIYKTSTYNRNLRVIEGFQLHTSKISAPRINILTPDYVERFDILRPLLPSLVGPWTKDRSNKSTLRLKYQKKEIVKSSIAWWIFKSYTFFRKNFLSNATNLHEKATDKNDYLPEKKWSWQLTVNDQQRLELYCHLV